MKTRYLTDSEVDEITTAIYNDALETLYEDVSDTVDELYNPKVVKELFEDKGIEYFKIPEYDQFIITKEGRVFNSKTIHYIKPILTGSSIFVMLKSKRESFEDLFENHGWIYDQDAIIKNYKDNNWDITPVGNGIVKYNKV